MIALLTSSIIDTGVVVSGMKMPRNLIWLIGLKGSGGSCELPDSTGETPKVPGEHTLLCRCQKLTIFQAIRVPGVTIHAVGKALSSCAGDRGSNVV